MAAKRLKNCQTMIDNLPKEIIFEIFSRLPIQFISRIRFVCKSWFDFINDTDFVNLHHYSRIIRTDPSFLILSMPDFYLANLDEKHGCFLPKETSRSVNLICSVNGLVCLRYTHEFGYREIDTFHIWNPITRDVFKVPRSPSNDINDFYSENGVCGFALDSTTNRYKLVHSWYVSNYDDEVEVESTEIGIYTLGVRNWKMIQHIPSSFRFFENASQVFLNGALHFKMKLDNPEYKNCIGVIDIVSESFRALEGLNDYTDRKYSSLYVVEDRLCLSVYSEDHRKVTLWTMNDYGVTETWTARYTIYNCRLVSLFKDDVFSRYPDGVCLKILNTRRKGVVLFVTGDTQRYYDLENKEFQNLQIGGISGHYPYREIGADVHLCSLISPRSLAGTRTKKTVPMLLRRSKILLRSREKNRVK